MNKKMGYHTFYNFSVEENLTDEKFNDLLNDFQNTCENANYAFNDEGRGDQSCTWYDHEKETKEFSKRHPDVVFCMSGEGDEKLDVWNKYFKNGKMQSCPAITLFDEYDESKLE